MWKRSVSSLLILLCCAAPTAAETIGKNTTWSGSIVLKEEVRVAPGVTLTVAPGTTVRAEKAESGITLQGTIKVAGSAAAPVVFTGAPGWKGITLAETGPLEHRIDYARFEQAENGISIIAGKIDIRHAAFRNCGTGVKLVREGRVLVEDSVFEKNEIGIGNEMKSQVTIRRNRFVAQTKTAILASHGSSGPIEGNHFERNEQAIGLMQTYPDRISGNRFLRNKVGIYCNQTQNSPLIRDNSFEGHENALVNFSFAYPAVVNNSFTGNETAIRNDQFGSPKVSHNLLRGNKLAIYNYRKSNPEIEQNVIDANDKALYCDYSSYPKVRNNNFTGNKIGVELGIYQSADWEKRSGSKEIVQEQAKARNSRNQMLGKAPTEFRDVVDVSGNWWGDDTRALAANPTGNHPFFFDRKDKAKVTYPGFGSGSYALDEIRYSPWLTAPVATAGLEKK